MHKYLIFKLYLIGSWFSHFKGKTRQQFKSFKICIMRIQVPAYSKFHNDHADPH